MKTIDDIRRQLAAGEYELTRHAFRRAVERNISEAEIRQAGRSAEIIEEYADDKYSPSCLLLGYTRRARPLHIQVSYAESDLVHIITLYQPDSEIWYNDRRRR